jgi:hypothetical protein
MDNTGDTFTINSGNNDSSNEDSSASDDNDVE